MFDLVVGKAEHIPGGGGAPVVVSTALHVVAVGALVAIPLMFATDVMPEVPTMMAFVVSAPPSPPPPPPPPAPAPATPDPSRRARTTAPTAAAPIAAPVQAPASIAPEPVASGVDEGAGVEGGVAGGIPGGVVGGVVGGIPESIPAPPPAPSEAPRAAVRVGGQIEPPTLLRRVEPIYPALAAHARVQGTVILEAMVDEQGQVQQVKVLRSIPLLDVAALEAVRQWRYSPVILNGRPVSFVLTVVLTFSIPTSS